MTPAVMANEVLAMDRQIPIYFSPDDISPNDMALSGVIDSAAFADTGMGGGRADVMNSLGCRWTPCEKGAGSRLAGLSAIHSRLALERDGRPGLVVFRACRNLIRTLPALPYSPRNPEDLDTNAEDHAVDALRYGLTRVKHFFRSVRVIGIQALVISILIKPESVLVSCSWLSKPRLPSQIEFCVRGKELVALSRSDKHLAVGEERRGKEASSLSHASGLRPQPGRRIIEFREGESIDPAKSSSDKDLTAGK